MKRPSTVEIVKRWMDMDRLLAGEGLFLRPFAEKWGISIRTINRDLLMFEQLGYLQRHEVVKRGPSLPGWFVKNTYREGIYPMFAANLKN